MTDATAAEPTDNQAMEQSRDLSGARDMIACEGVSKWYGDFQALDGITATIKEQEVVVVLGPSGSGKSTWIRCINRLEVHQEGRIVVDDVELTNDLRNIEQVRSEVGMVFQL
ncbi:MAG: ATP-binding cassette domain-containing protein, partial [Acidimicrobiales bacterium]|nr:ATP-binding cassette domain-containing protein [Acidimicrobiales bacterium]